MVGYSPLFNVDDDGEVDVVESKLIAKDPPPSALRTQILACFLTAQTRQIIRHVPLDVTGHGYRFIGFKLNSSAGWQSELVDWIAPDACLHRNLHRRHPYKLRRRTGAQRDVVPSNFRSLHLSPEQTIALLPSIASSCCHLRRPAEKRPLAPTII